MCTSLTHARPAPNFHFANFLAYKAYIRHSYQRKHSMQIKSALAHLPAAEKKRVESMRAHLRQNTAIEQQRGRLRSSSINKSEVVNYAQIAAPRSPPHEAGPQAKRRKTVPSPSDRLLALRDRLLQHKPNRYDHVRWMNYKNISIKKLSPYYPNSTTPKLLILRFLLISL